MKSFIALFIILAFSFEENALAFCSNGEQCSKNNQYLASNTNISPEIISNIQAQFNGRVISVQPSSDGNISIQILTQNDRVIIVTIDSSGSIINVQE